MDGYEFTASLVARCGGSLVGRHNRERLFGSERIKGLLSKVRSVSFGGSEMQFVSAIVEKTRKETVEQMLEPPPPAAEDLSTLKTEKLKYKVGEFANKIRRWENEMKARGDELVLSTKRLESWDDYREQVLRNSNAKNRLANRVSSFGASVQG